MIFLTYNLNQKNKLIFMDSKQNLVATVKSPAKDGHIREGKGFSLTEIKEAGKDIKVLKALNIFIDYFRKSKHPENIEKLKALKIESERKKKQPFIKKEKKRTSFKPKTEKPVEKVVEAVIETVEEIPAKKKKEVKKKSVKKAKPKAVKVEKVSEESKGVPLTELSGLGAATAKKFNELGVNSCEDLCKEKPEDLAPLIKGVSVERLKKWIEEGKELIK